MTLTQLKQLKSFCNNLHSQPDWQEVLAEIEKGETDFTVNEVRFIHDDNIEDILIDELESDKYILGCFSSWAIADATDWPEELIKAAQNGEQFEAIGEGFTRKHIARLAEILVSHDGYGHHFNHYDGSEEELSINGQFYHVFDNH